MAHPDLGQIVIGPSLTLWYKKKIFHQILLRSTYNMFWPEIVAGSSFSIGFLGIFGAWWFYVAGLRKHARARADEFIAEAKKEAHEMFKLKKADAQIHEKQARKKFEKDIRKQEQRVEQIRKKIEEKENRHQAALQKKYDVYSQEKSTLSSLQERVDLKVRKLNQRQDRKNGVRQNYVDRLLDKTNTRREDVIESLRQKLINTAKVSMSKWASEYEEEIKEDSERKAKQVIMTALNRFARPFCELRGLGYVSFTKQEVAQRVLGPDKKHLPLIEKICGVDLIYDEKNLNLSVSGFDPVRRELARAAIEKMMHDKTLDEKRIESLVNKTKKELFKKIRINGDRFAKELGARDLSPEIKNTMGALMYRYSFSQNQYFHCAEVGQLCGLFSSELDLSITDGKRAGALHDLGKAMDHSIDGGHAVIGADFIEKHGEQEKIVHAVRAHHFDETPKTELAYLVIAADAISGARPGARRSTTNSYMQKMEDLELVANGFPEVIDTLILSAGREVRVQVNGSKVDDYKSLDLSQKIAKKIQEECAYPGTIKVTVVRKTQAIEYAK